MNNLEELFNMNSNINLSILKNDEIIKLEYVYKDVKLKELFKRKIKSTTPQHFTCNNCMHVWVCAYCYHYFCDDIMSPYMLEGKPKYWSICDVDPEYLKTLTEKEKNKMIIKYSNEPPNLGNFALCKWCKEEYIEKNTSKGRHPNKIGRRESLW